MSEKFTYAKKIIKHKSIVEIIINIDIFPVKKEFIEKYPIRFIVNNSESDAFEITNKYDKSYYKTTNIDSFRKYIDNNEDSYEVKPGDEIVINYSSPLIKQSIESKPEIINHYLIPIGKLSSRYNVYDRISDLIVAIQDSSWSDEVG